MLGKEQSGLLTAREAVRLPLKQGGHRLVRWQQTRVESEAGSSTTYLLGVDVTDEAEMQRRTNRAERLAAVGTLAAGLAHEVRNPLNSASLQLQALRRRLRRVESAQSEGLTPIIDRVQDEIQRLDGLVGEFLAFARPGALHLADTDLNDLIEGLVALLRPEADAGNVRIELSLDPGVGRVRVDAGQIRQVVHNLVRNALQAMSDGGTLTLRTIAANELAQVGLDVQDDGPGFQENAPVFDAFYTTKGDGTGLGLAIVHRIVQEHGGGIEAESRPGRTVFRVRLPQPKRE
jgi:signal transduction histidine kinase